MTGSSARGEGREGASYIARCPKHGLHGGDRAKCFVCGGPVEQVPMVQLERLQEEGRVAWILWGLQDGDSLPLGAYASKEVALAAQDAAGSHENAASFDDFWVTPWPLRDEPTLNFRIALARPTGQGDSG